MAIITLITDFGLADEYVGVMKGAILAVNPAAVIVDICHQIPAQDVGAAGRMLAAGFAVFPPATIHVAVVDPGVGSARAIVAVRAVGHLFLAPDNGLLSLVINRHRPEQIVKLEDPRWFRPVVSRTFHGRDIFAPVAGHLSLGIDIGALGPALNQGELTVCVPSAPTVGDGGRIEGQVTDVDGFGNLITDVDETLIGQLRQAFPTATLTLTIGPVRLTGLTATYADAPADALVALVGSRGLVEVALRDGSAAQRLGCGRGAKVVVEPAGSVVV